MEIHGVWQAISTGNFDIEKAAVGKQTNMKNECVYLLRVSGDRCNQAGGSQEKP